MMTIISRETIKPSSPTPSHLHTYNLSQIDQCAPHSYIPLVFFYSSSENSNLTPDDKTQVLKKSLSQSLTRYYPFAGRLQTPTSSYVDCNDEGVLFVEAKSDSQMDRFKHMSHDEDDYDAIGQLFADGMVWQKSTPTSIVLGIRLNHFACGGIGVAVSMSHRIGDGYTIGSFMTYWASLTHYGSHHKILPLLNPHFIQYPTSTNDQLLPPDASVLIPISANHVTRKFVFPNSKVNELKNKVIELAETGSTLSIANLTRVEVLTTLIYKTAVAAATPKSGGFKPYFLVMPVDIRKKFVPKLPPTTVGNFVSFMMVKTGDTSDTSFSVVVSEIKKEKTKLDVVSNVQQVSENLESFLSRLRNEDIEHITNRSFWCSSMCGFPRDRLDFGWGKPAAVIYGSDEKTGCMLMDTPDGDAIEAWVTLPKQDMEIFQNDKELTAFIA